MAVYSLYDGKWLTEDFEPWVVAYYFREWQGYSMKPHYHDRVEIMYVIAGSALVEVMKTRLVMDKGDFILIDAGVSHRLEVAKTCRMLNIEFVFRERTTCCPSLRELAVHNGSLQALLKRREPYLLQRDPQEIYGALKNLIMELDSQRADSACLTQLLLGEILLKISRLAAEMAQGLDSVSNLHVKRALRFMHEHYDQDIKVQDIAAHLDLHVGYFHRIFKDYTKHSPGAYLTALRLQKAKMLLTQTDIPITEIPAYVGINSHQYFSTLFKKHTGQTPQKYRNSFQKRKTAVSNPRENVFVSFSNE